MACALTVMTKGIWPVSAGAGCSKGRFFLSLMGEAAGQEGCIALEA